MIQQFSCEIQRLHLLAQICTVLFRAFKNSDMCGLKSKHFQDMKTLLNALHGSSSVDAQIEKRCKIVVEEWSQVIDTVPGIGITWTERAGIISAMGLNRGHWYKCPKGHVYAIGECGRPTQQSKCPGCGSGIGGRDHQSSSGNERADQIMFDRDFYD